MTTSRKTIHGVGIGLRSAHYEYIHRQQPDTPWFEVLIDNYLGRGGIIYDHLARVSEQYPLTFHGVGMSLGSTDPLNQDYLDQLKQAIDTFAPVHISDHLCWTGVHQQYTHDLLPLPYTEQTAQHVAQRIAQVQDKLGQRILIENVSSYLSYANSEYSEAEFVARVCQLADCDLLLDINNIYVSAYNHQFDAHDYLRQMPAARIKEIHLAGYEDQGTHLLDTHGQAVHPPVWQLYETALTLFGARPTLIEWDNDIPAFSVLEAEAHKATKYLAAYHVDAA